MILYKSETTLIWIQTSEFRLCIALFAIPRSFSLSKGIWPQFSHSNGIHTEPVLPLAHPGQGVHEGGGGIVRYIVVWMS